MSTHVTPLLSLENISKNFGDVTASDGVNLSVAPGEVVSMLGENGAGKSTLMKIAYGLVRADSGTVSVEGEEIDLRSPRAAIEAGIGMVTQEFSLVDTMTVAENIALSGVGHGRVNPSELRANVHSVMDRIGVQLPVDRLVGELSIGERQRVEIIKALYNDCKVLILDEPTAVLTPQDIESLFATVRSLRERNLGVLFVSHKLREVAETSDRVVVLRHGKLVANLPISETTQDSLAALMMGVTSVDSTDLATAGARGSHPSEDAGRPETEASAPMLTVEHVSLRQDDVDVLRDVSVEVRAHEVVGIAGISGNGQSQLVDVLAGVVPGATGNVRVSGTDLTGVGVDARLKAGLGRLTEDRRGTTFQGMTVEQNLAIEDLGDFRRRGLLDRRGIRKHAEKLIEEFAIKARPTDQVRNLSGGNIQKILLARAFAREPLALIAAQPTRGLDIRTSEYVHEQIHTLRDSGAGILLISEDLDELRALSDRILVMFRGEVVAEFDIEAATSERLGKAMTGGSEAA